MELREFLDQLTRESARGDLASFEHLLVHCHDRVQRRIRRGIPLDLERHFDAADVLQETFRAAVEGIGGFRGSSFAEFHAWLDTIARHQLHNVRQRYRARKRGGDCHAVALEARDVVADGSPDDELLELLAHDTRSPRSKVARREYVQLVREALQQLEPHHREIVRLRFVDQLRHAEIAVRTGRTEDAVKMICFRAIRHLRTLMPADDSRASAPAAQAAAATAAAAVIGAAPRAGSEPR
jgi:RNA polymerase sigma-70 factor (ECF subfamily)